MICRACVLIVISIRLGEKMSKEQYQIVRENMENEEARRARVAKEIEKKQAKPRPTLVPTELIRETTLAMEFGTTKYEVDDWRTNPKVSKRQIQDALLRHLLAYLEGETHADDSKVHHLGHMGACIGILLARFEK